MNCSRRFAAASLPAALLIASITLLGAQPVQAQECTRVNDRGAEIRLPDGTGPLHVQVRGESGTWRNYRGVTDGKLYVGDLSRGKAAEVRYRADGAADWTQPMSCAAEPQRVEASSWSEYLRAIDSQPFEVYGLPARNEGALARAWGAEVTARGDHYLVQRHGGAMKLLPQIVFAAAREGIVPRFGIDGHGDPGPLTTDDKNRYRALWDLIATWSKLPPRPGVPDPTGPIPGWVMDPLTSGEVNPAPDGGGYPEDGTPLGPNDKMCKYLTCEPFSCGQPPLPPDGEFQDCSGLQEELDDLADLIDYWNQQGQFWLDTSRYLELTLQGKSTAEMGVQVANMATALGMILAPEPVSTVAGVVLAATTFADFATGQLMDAIGLCGSAADCGAAAALAEANNKVQEILARVVDLRAQARAVREALFACLGQAATANAALQAEVDAFNQAMQAYEACRQSQVCEWRSRPCG